MIPQQILCKTGDFCYKLMWQVRSESANFLIEFYTKSCFLQAVWGSMRYHFLMVRSQYVTMCLPVMSYYSVYDMLSNHYITIILFSSPTFLSLCSLHAFEPNHLPCQSMLADFSTISLFLFRSNCCHKVIF